ncbi:MAG: hypothetical protein EOO38_00040 [Cytophagaceae bacterium]|nr:MAG: hypothetical protein EOO38_00040 [Cytophagaceae bacterium]
MWGLTGFHTLLEGDEQLTCIRQGRRVTADVTYVDGLPCVSHTAAQFEITATVQPMGGRDLMLQPEAFRDKNMLSLWQAHRTRKQDVIRLTVTDIILFRGSAYQVQSAEDWQSYTKATLCQIDVGSYAGVIDPENLPPLYPAPPVPEPSPVISDEELDVLNNPYDLYDVGILSMQQAFSPGDVYDFRVPGDPDQATFRYKFPRDGVILGFTLTGSIAGFARVGGYVTKRVSQTGQTSDAYVLDPYTQPYYNDDAGLRVTFETPIAYAQDDIAQMKARLADGARVNFACFLQVGLKKVDPQS